MKLYINTDLVLILEKEELFAGEIPARIGTVYLKVVSY
jgi:hypothetical protein